MTENFEDTTGKVRFIVRSGEKILQQQWIVKEIVDRMPIKVELQWRDVMVESE